MNMAEIQLLYVYNIKENIFEETLIAREPPPHPSQQMPLRIFIFFELLPNERLSTMLEWMDGVEWIPLDCYDYWSTCVAKKVSHTRTLWYFMYPNMRADHNMPSIILKKQNLFVTEFSHTALYTRRNKKNPSAIWPIVSHTFVAKQEMSFQLFDISLV